MWLQNHMGVFTQTPSLMAVYLWTVLLYDCRMSVFIRHFAVFFSTSGAWAIWIATGGQAFYQLVCQSEFLGPDISRQSHQFWPQPQHHLQMTMSLHSGKRFCTTEEKEYKDFLLNNFLLHADHDNNNAACSTTHTNDTSMGRKNFSNIIFSWSQVRRCAAITNENSGWLSWYSCHHASSSMNFSRSPLKCQFCTTQEAQLWPSDRAMRLVSSNLANYHATVQKLLIQVHTKPMAWTHTHTPV